MLNSSDSDSEDDTQIAQLLEAADTMLLTNDMFQQTQDAKSANKIEENLTGATKAAAKPVPKSQRYLNTLDDQSADNAIDLNFSKEVQTHIWKKLSTIIEHQVEFSIHKENKSRCIKEPKSRVRLLQGAEEFLKAYDGYDGETEPKQPQKRPKIHRRQLETPTVVSENELRAISVSGADILAGVDTQAWARRKLRQDKFFSYVADSHGLLHAQPFDEISMSIKRKHR